ncbi:hypothetical protein ACFO6Q_01405 [Dokdonella ginsengisoli]|uniref:Uncharacterized protein n=2 Tax=Dokdonella ginsengisoli TaxID=363846 RepID=A0ABV9QTQ7_9GAMM
MRPLTCLIAAGMLAVSAPRVWAAANVAYGEAFDTLYSVQLDSRQATELGRSGLFRGQIIGNISGLTTTADGSLYAAAGGFKLLVKIDPQDGRASVIGSFGLDGQGDPSRNDALDLNMIAGCDDTLWLSSAVANKLWKVDPASGATTLVGSTGHTITGLAARGDRLYGAGGKGDNNFYGIDPQTGAATLIGPFGPAVTTWVNSISMSFDDAGTLWAVINYVPPLDNSQPVADWSDLATIDPATGTVTVLGPVTGPESLRQVGMKGFTVGPTQCTRGTTGTHAAPVGSPWALALLGLLLAAAGAGGAARALRR